MLKEEQQRTYSNIGRLLPDLFAVFELPNQNLVYLNPAGLARFDPAGSADFQRLRLTDCIGMSDADRFQREVYPQLRVRGFWAGQLSLRDVLGSEFKTDAKLQEVRDPGHGPSQFYLFAELPRDHQEVNGTSATDEDMLHALLDTIPSQVYFKDVSGRYLRISRSKALKHNLSDPRDSIGKTDFDYFTVEHSAPAFQDEQRIIKTGEAVIDFEEKETFTDGSVRWVSSTKLPFFNRSGKLVGTYGISRDITVQKQAEEAIREREALFRTVFNGSSDAILLMSDSRLIDCNAKALELFGLSKDDLLAKHPADLSPPQQPDGRNSREAAIAYLEQAMQQGRCRFEWVHQRGANEDFPTEIVLSVFTFRGQPVIHGVIRDLTETKKAEQERRELEARVQLTSKLESVGSLAAGVAHEVNTPTQFISDNVRFLKDACQQLANVIASYRSLVPQAPEYGELRAALDAVEQENELAYLLDEVPRCIDQSLDGLRRIGKIVGSLKEFSHPGGEEKNLANINRAIETTVAVSRHEWKYVADIVTELDPGMPKVSCVIDEINQAILNLIVNASHAIEDANKITGTAKGLIVIRTKADATYAIIEVQDSGTGIPEGVRDRIFEPFYTTKPVGKGTGQGLAIVQAVVVKKHHGNISFTTEMNKGTTFRLALPLNPPPPGSTRQTLATGK